MTGSTAKEALRLALATGLVGIAGGFGGMTMALLLHQVQHLAYGYSLHDLVGPESFLQAVSAAPPWRRVAALTVGGLIAGLGWWAVYNRGSKLVSIKDAVSSGKAMPGGSTTAHAVLQVVTVALGSPLGREVAPREISALLAQMLTRWLKITGDDAKLLLACGAGAGLAAVYNVPLGGAVFTLEVLLKRADAKAVAASLATSCIATMVAWSGLGDSTQYHIPVLSLSVPLLVLSVFSAPMIGTAGFWFAKLSAAARRHMRTDGRIVARCLFVFLSVGVAAIAFPQLPGNGKGPLQLALDCAITPDFGLELLGLKVIAISGALWAGAEGGVLTPGLTVGGLLSGLLVILWNTALPVVAPGAFVIAGAAAFLGVSMDMPFTAVALMFGFTGVSQDFLVPLILMSVLASATARTLPLFGPKFTAQARAFSARMSGEPPNSGPYRM